MDLTQSGAQPTIRVPAHGTLLIGGTWRHATNGATFQTRDPSTGSLLASLSEASPFDVDLAVAAARSALTGPWARFTPADRQARILRLADLVVARFDELTVLDSLEMGAPISRQRSRERRIQTRLRYYGGAAMFLEGETIPNSVSRDVLSFTVKEPVGVVGAIIPWNGPLTAALSKIAPVLATGCTMVLKPAEEASLSTILLGELIAESDIPAGVVNIVTGFGESAGAALVAHPGVDKVAFTGSQATGQAIVRASAGNLKRLSLELGGKSPHIIFADADLDAAVPAAALAVFSNSGQICNAGSRLYVEQSVFGSFTAAVARYAATLKIGHSLDAETQIGPLVSAAQLNRVTSYFRDGVAEGARPLIGGERLSGPPYDNGYFMPPTVFVDATDDMRISREEIFGPIVTAMPFSDIDDLLRRANDTAYGLGAGIWTTNLQKAHALANQLRVGTVWINCYGLVDAAVPFGGYKMSGFGRESGLASLDEYLNVKSVWIDHK